MKYEKPSLQIYMIDDDDIICTSGEDLGGIEIGPGLIPGTGEDGSGYH